MIDKFNSVPNTKEFITIEYILHYSLLTAFSSVERICTRACKIHDNCSLYNGQQRDNYLSYYENRWSPNKWTNYFSILLSTFPTSFLTYTYTLQFTINLTITINLKRKKYICTTTKPPCRLIPNLESQGSRHSERNTFHRPRYN